MTKRTANHRRDEAGEIVRLYNDGSRRFVRDPRTGVRVKDIDGVLEHGRIDDFLIGRVRLALGVSREAPTF